VAKAPKRSTPTDDELRDELRYWPEWMDFGEAQLHVADIVGGLGTAAEALRRRIISGDIEIQSESGNLKPEDFRAATVDMFGCLSLAFDVRDYGVRLRRADVYRIWPTRWMGAEGRARLEPTAEPGRPVAPPPAGQTAPQAPQLPELLATRPDDVPRMVWITARTIYELRLRGDTSIKREIEAEKVSNELGLPKGKPSLRTYYEAIRWLREKKLI
jgi:hypothetical protein